MGDSALGLSLLGPATAGPVQVWRLSVCLSPLPAACLAPGLPSWEVSAEPVFHSPPSALPPGLCWLSRLVPYRLRGADEQPALTADSKATTRGGHGREC